MVGRRDAGNLVLAKIPARDLSRMRPHLMPVVLKFGQVLYVPGQPVHAVYFPIDCLISFVAAVDARRMLEVGMMGSEGMAGIPFVPGVQVSAGRTVVRAAGAALRMAVAPFQVELNRSRPLQRELLRLNYMLTAQIAQTAACNRFHDAEARLARWLLMTRDRVGSNELRLTQEFMASMLGFRRAGITEAASGLKRQKLIRYHRGALHIQDAKGLKASACSCYRILNTVYARARRSG
jgi:CRP-like cAMP-binding protein